MKRSKNRVAAFALAILLGAMSTVPGLAAESADSGNPVYIRTAQDLEELSRNCSVDGWSVDKTVYLEADIDLSDSDFQPIPIFSGIFDGKGHTVSGFTLSGSGDDRGFFRYIQAGAVVQNLAVSCLVTPNDRKDNIGGLAGVNSGKILNCTCTGRVEAGTNVGGLVGLNKAAGQLINCIYSGVVLGEHYVGGVVGRNEGSVIRCQNQGDVNTTEVKTTVTIHEVELSDIRSTENIPACTDIGGIAGASVGILQSCTNSGNVGYEHVGYNIGGIAGRQSGWLDSCVNTGTVRGRKDVGGICGQMEPRLTLLFDTDDLDDLWDELDTLQSLMDQAISDAERASDSVSAQMAGVTNSADEVKNAAVDLSDALVGWADENLDTVNDVSARISWAMERLEPIVDAADAALGRFQDSAALMSDALSEVNDMSGPSQDALDDARLAAERVNRAAQSASKALQQIRESIKQFENGLGDNAAMQEAAEHAKAALANLADAFGMMQSAFVDFVPALDILSPGLDGVDWDAVQAAFTEMSGAIGQIQDAVALLKDALDSAQNITGELFQQTLQDLAAATKKLYSGLDQMDQAAQHIKDALNDLEAAAPHGESAVTLLGQAADALEDACGQLRRAGDTFSDVMAELAEKPAISFSPVGDVVKEQEDILSDSMSGLNDAMQQLNDTILSSADVLLEDMRAINQQFGRVIDVLKRRSSSSENERTEDDEELLEDVSDQVTKTDENAGRITSAKNMGAVEGDVNVAGIAGSMAIEYDYDPEDDLTVSGDRSLNFRYQAAALTEGCVNNGEVTGKKDYVGGIVGRMDLGTVSRCESYASVKSTDGDYVGGIAGAAWSAIHDCWARCALSGKDYIGGVAGLGKTVTNCRALTEIDAGSAYLGAVLGDRAKDGEVSGNCFTHETLSGINGVSYLGQAEPVDFAALSEGAPDDFTQFRLVFKADGQEVAAFDFSYGDALTELPSIPEKEGYSASWPDINYDCLTFSRTLEAEYTAYSTALTALGDPPKIVAEGTFSAASVLTASADEGFWVDSVGTSHAGTIYTVTVADPSRTITSFQVQYKISDSEKDGTVWVKTADGWTQREADVDGTYLVFEAEGDAVTFTVQKNTASTTYLPLLIGIALVLCALAVVCIKKRRSSKKAMPQGSQEKDLEQPE